MSAKLFAFLSPHKYMESFLGHCMSDSLLRAKVNLFVVSRSDCNEMFPPTFVATAETAAVLIVVITSPSRIYKSSGCNEFPF